MITSKLKSKGRTRVPLPVRNALRLAEGDEILYTLESERVILTKARYGFDPFIVFGEWSSDADSIGYADL
jgi:antitoxin PrlF